MALQIAASGPDSSWERIKFGYIKMIDSARRSVWIQTPYFMPDYAVLDALKIAARSGLDVRHDDPGQAGPPAGLPGDA